jgi:dihydrofolate reductase
VNGAERSIGLIAALDLNRLIGRDGTLPWRLPNDLAHFKRLTLGKTVLMGRKTWDSLGRPLPGRDNWVVSRAADFAPAGARVFASIEAALDAHAQGELMVIGGAELYRQTLDRAERLYLTQVLARIEGHGAADVHFPAFDPADFEERTREDHAQDARHAHPYRFLTLQRRAPVR